MLISTSTFTGNVKLFFLFYILTIGYLVIYLAYVPTGFVRNYNKLGDYSYGIYIYAFPVQQSVAAILTGVGVMKMFTISFPITLLIGILSWHIVEKPMLNMKSKYPYIAATLARLRRRVS